MICQCRKGTVWYDHAAKRWRAGDHQCPTPFPRALGSDASPVMPIGPNKKSHWNWMEGE